MDTINKLPGKAKVKNAKEVVEFVYIDMAISC